jgi:hypothetical protein
VRDVVVSRLSTFEGAMKESNRPAINRRDAIGLLAASPVIASPLGAAAWAGASGLGTDAVQHGQGPLRMAANSAKLTAEHFEPLIGKTFAVGQHRLMLKKVRRGPKTASRFRQQFAIEFHAPQELTLADGPLSVSHPAIGRQQLLVTQVGKGAGRAVEICFG